MASIRTYTLDHYTAPDPGGGEDVVLNRPLAVTVGTQALEPGVSDGKTLIRFAMNASNPLLERKPKMRLKILPNESLPDGAHGPVFFDCPESLEMCFDNGSFVTECKEMPVWLAETLEFAAKTLRAQYELNQLAPATEQIDAHDANPSGDNASKIPPENDHALHLDSDYFDQGDAILFGRAYELLRSAQTASTALIQRRLRLSHNRAALIMGAMEKIGIVGPENDSAPRKILVDLDTFLI